MTEPSRYFTQHFAVEAPSIDADTFRAFWRVRHLVRLDGLLRDRAISFPVWRAGVEYRTLAEIRLASIYPAKGFDQSDAPRSGFDGGIARRIDAADRLVGINRRLGRGRVKLLEAHLVDDLEWAELGRRCHVHAKTARRWTIAALEVLSKVIWQ
jgi:hypothetical protein